MVRMGDLRGGREVDISFMSFFVCMSSLLSYGQDSLYNQLFVFFKIDKHRYDTTYGLRMRFTGFQ